jgi:hypothetical protein
MKLKKAVRVSEILEVWESFSGWYWYVTEYHEDSLAYGVVHGFETEWGYFSLDELRELERKGMVWQVPESNWLVCPGVVKGAASYSNSFKWNRVVLALGPRQPLISRVNNGERRWWLQWVNTLFYARLKPDMVLRSLSMVIGFTHRGKAFGMS